MPAPTLPERRQALIEQLRTHRGQLAEAHVTVERIATQCAQIEGALGLCDALIAIERETDDA